MAFLIHFEHYINELHAHTMNKNQSIYSIEEDSFQHDNLLYKLIKAKLNNKTSSRYFVVFLH
jgi:hypothetical protein